MGKKYHFHLWSFYIFAFFLVFFIIGLSAFIPMHRDEPFIVMIVAGIFSFVFGLTHLIKVGLKTSVEIDDSHIAVKGILGSKEAHVGEISKITALMQFKHHTTKGGARITEPSKIIKVFAGEKPLIKINANMLKDNYSFYSELRQMAAKNKIRLEASIKDEAGLRSSIISYDLSMAFAGGLKKLMAAELANKNQFMVSLDKALRSGKINNESWVVLMREYKRRVEKEDDPGLKQQKLNLMNEYYFS